MTAKKKPAKKSSARIKPDRIASALQSANGNISVAAKLIGVSRNVIYQHVKKSDDLQQILTDSREAIVDYAENALLQAVAEKQGWAVCFTLKTLGRARGYVEQINQQVSGQLSILNIDYSNLTDEQLERIANGEHPATVIASTSGR